LIGQNWALAIDSWFPTSGAMESRQMWETHFL